MTVIATAKEINVSVEYDDKYCPCTIIVPNELNTSFPSIYNLLNTINTIQSFQCASPTFLEFYARPYADSLKHRKYVFDEMQLIVNSVDINLLHKNMIIFDCVVKQNKKLQTYIYLKVNYDALPKQA